MSGAGHERRFRDVLDESGLTPTPERLRHRSEPTLRATRRHAGVVIPSGNVAPCEKEMNGVRKGTEEPVNLFGAVSGDEPSQSAAHLHYRQSRPPFPEVYSWWWNIAFALTKIITSPLTQGTGGNSGGAAGFVRPGCLS